MSDPSRRIFDDVGALNDEIRRQPDGIEINVLGRQDAIVALMSRYARDAAPAARATSKGDPPHLDVLLRWSEPLLHRRELAGIWARLARVTGHHGYSDEPRATSNRILAIFERCAPPVDHADAVELSSLAVTPGVAPRIATWSMILAAHAHETPLLLPVDAVEPLSWFRDRPRNSWFEAIETFTRAAPPERMLERLRVVTRLAGDASVDSRVTSADLEWMRHHLALVLVPALIDSDNARLTLLLDRIRGGADGAVRAIFEWAKAHAGDIDQRRIDSMLGRAPERGDPSATIPESHQAFMDAIDASRTWSPSEMLFLEPYRGRVDVASLYDKLAKNLDRHASNRSLDRTDTMRAIRVLEDEPRAHQHEFVFHGLVTRLVDPKGDPSSRDALANLLGRFSDLTQTELDPEKRARLAAHSGALERPEHALVLATLSLPEGLETWRRLAESLERWPDSGVLAHARISALGDTDDACDALETLVDRLDEASLRAVLRASDFAARPGSVSVWLARAARTGASTRQAILNATLDADSAVVEPAALLALTDPLMSLALRERALETLSDVGTRRCLARVHEVRADPKLGALAASTHDAIVARLGIDAAAGGGLSLSDGGDLAGALSQAGAPSGAVALYERVERALDTWEDTPPEDALASYQDTGLAKLAAPPRDIGPLPWIMRLNGDDPSRVAFTAMAIAVVYATTLAIDYELALSGAGYATTALIGLVVCVGISMATVLDTRADERLALLTRGELVHAEPTGRPGTYTLTDERGRSVLHEEVIEGVDPSAPAAALVEYDHEGRITGALLIDGIRTVRVHSDGRVGSTSLGWLLAATHVALYVALLALMIR